MENIYNLERNPNEKYDMIEKAEAFEKSLEPEFRFAKKEPVKCELVDFFTNSFDDLDKEIIIIGE